MTDLARQFPIEKIERDGNGIYAAKIECCDCGGVAYSTSKAGLSPKAHEQHFRNHGWIVGNGPRRDKCPTCKKRKPELKVVKMEAPKAEAPREMGREDRRIITDKLDEVYDDKTTRYRSPWTDAAVSRDLGVPRAWVSDVREQFFGPEGSNEEFDRFMEQAAPVIADMKNLFSSLHGLVERVKAVEPKIAELERIGRRIERELGR